MNRCVKKPDAVAQVRGGSGAPQLSGCIQFYQEIGCVLIVARVSGLPQDSETGFLGFHIHEGSSCSGSEYSETGSHYSPNGLPHPKHAGDLPPLLMCQGNAYLSFKTDRFTVKEILGRTIVIHSDPDDFHSQHSGNAGRRIACGIIQKDCSASK